MSLFTCFFAIHTATREGILCSQHMPPRGRGGRKSGADGDPGPAEPSEAERHSFLNAPRPFKSASYLRPQSKKLRSTKQILTAERERDRLEREKLKEAAKDVEGKVSLSSRPKEIPTYLSIEAPPSLLPQKRYCDLTGLEAPYTDPHSKLRYHNKSVYEAIKALPPGADLAYLAIRGQHSVVK